MKIGIVNDLPMAVEALRRIVTKAGGHQIAWVAENGEIAVQRCAQNTPDLVLMDLIMPVMDGVEATRRIMKGSPCPVLVVTASVDGNSAKVFEAMGSGALDVVATPVLGHDNDDNGRELLKKIDRIQRISGDAKQSSAQRQGRFEEGKLFKRGNNKCLLAIGASTGGPQALVEILAAFPRDLSASVIVAQHMDTQFVNGLVQWLDGQVAPKVSVLTEGELPQPGVVLIPATTNHLVMRVNNTLGYAVEPKNNFYHPSVDVFFKSVARYWRGDCIGVILTGMGRDGAEGLLALQEKGHYSIAQDQESSVVFGMPKAAIELGAAYQVLPVSKIGPTIVDMLAQGKGKSNG